MEAASLFDILERQVVPLFYDRSEGAVPRRWVRRVKANLASLGPQVVASRMVRDYVEQLYEPLAAHVDALGSGRYARARDLAAWKARVSAGWSAVRVVSVDTETAVTDLGAERHVEATVALGDLGGEDVAVEMLHGSVGPAEELLAPQRSPMSPDGDADDQGNRRYTGSFCCETAGRYGFTVRIVPAHPDLVTSAELGRVAWA